MIGTTAYGFLGDITNKIIRLKIFINLVNLKFFSLNNIIYNMEIIMNNVELRDLDNQRRYERKKARILYKAQKDLQDISSKEVLGRPVVWCITWCRFICIVLWNMLSFRIALC